MNEVLKSLTEEARQHKSVDDFSKALYRAHQAICKWKYYTRIQHYALATKYLRSAFGCLKTDTVATGTIELSSSMDILKIYNEAKEVNND